MIRCTVQPTYLIALVSLLLSGAGCIDAGHVTEVDQVSESATVRPRFELWQGSQGEFAFHLQAANGEILLYSQTYETRTAALNGLLAVIANGTDEANYVTKQGQDHQHYVTLRARNHQVIASAEGYATAQSAKRAIRTCARALVAYEEHWAHATGARYELREYSDESFGFSLHAKNGQVVLTSQRYTTKAAALNGAFAVAEAGADVAHFEIFEASSEQFYFVLRAANHEIIGQSEHYVSRSNAVRAMEHVHALIASGAAALL